jgi:transposase
LTDTIFIRVQSIRKQVICPFCGQPSSKTHSRYDKSFQDLPMQNKKVIIILSNRKMFCLNPDCNHTTFAETFDFLPAKAKKTKRLEDKIINIAMNVSSLTASAILKTNVAKVGKSTICNLLKKRHTDN